MTSAEIHELGQTESGWGGQCPFCQAKLSLPRAMYDAECFTGEIICSRCSNRFSIKLADDDRNLLILPNSKKELEQRVVEITKLFDRQVDKIRQRSKDAERYHAALANLARHTETQCQAILSEITKTNASSGSLAKIGDSAKDMAQTIEAVERKLNNANQQIKTLNPSLEQIKKNIGIFGNRLNDWTRIAKSNNHASLYTPLPPVHGIATTVSGNGSEPPNELPSRFREMLQSPETIKQFVAAFPNGFSVNLERNRAYESLPHLFDVVEQELYSWNHPERVVDSEAIRQAVIDVLQRMLLVMTTWQEVNGLERYGAPGDVYDYGLHDKYMTCETEDAEKFERVKDVVYSGYRLQQDRTLLRRARVIIWVPAINLAPTH